MEDGNEAGLYVHAQGLPTLRACADFPVPPAGTESAEVIWWLCFSPGPVVFWSDVCVGPASLASHTCTLFILRLRKLCFQLGALPIVPPQLNLQCSYINGVVSTLILLKIPSDELDQRTRS